MAESNDVVSFSEKNSEQTPEKPWKQLNLMLKFSSLILGFLLAIFISIYFLSDYSKVATLSVDGAEEVFDQEVIDASQIQSGDSLWRTYWNRSEIEENIYSDLPQLSQVNLSFSGLNDFIFEIEEYDTIAYILEDHSYWRVLENGTVLDSESQTSIGNYPVFIAFEEGDYLDRMIVQFDEVNDNVRNMISEVELVANERNPMLVRAYMNNGNQVLASIPTFSTRVNSYPQMVQVVEGQYGLFDLEAGAFFVPFVDNDPEEAELDESSEIEIDQETEWNSEVDSEGE